MEKNKSVAEKGALSSAQLPWLPRQEIPGLPAPALEEALRSAAYLVSTRQATRDYLDVAGLVDLLGEDASVEALKSLNVFGGDGNQTRITRFCEVSHQSPLDVVDLKTFKGVCPPYDALEYVQARVRAIGRRMLVVEMSSLDAPDLEQPSQATPLRSPVSRPTLASRKPRATTEVGFLDLVDTLCRGGTDDWRALFEACLLDLSLRAEVRDALPMVDPEIGSAGPLWAFLLEHMETRVLDVQPPSARPAVRAL